MTLGAKSAEVFPPQPRALSKIQAHRRIEPVKTRPAVGRDIKSPVGKALNRADKIIIKF